MPTSKQLVTQLGCLSAQQIKLKSHLKTYGSHLKNSILLNDLFLQFGNSNGTVLKFQDMCGKDTSKILLNLINTVQSRDKFNL